MVTLLPAPPARSNVPAAAPTAPAAGTPASAAPGGSRLRVATLTSDAHLAHLDGRGDAGFLQYPSWAVVKEGWRSEGIGWYDANGAVVGSALVLYRKMPKVPYWFAYLPEGPVIDWVDPNPQRWLDPLIEHMRKRNVFTVRMGPPLAHRRWQAQTVKDAVKHGLKHLDRVTPDEIDPLGATVALRLGDLGWRASGDGADAQPRYTFELPFEDRSLDQVKAGFNQEWKRAIAKAGKSGVDITVGGYEDLPAFFELLQVTERRNGFRLGRELPYYERQFRALNTESAGRMKLYLARFEDRLLAAHTLISAGSRVWYQTGASTDHGRGVRPSHALQWRMIQDVYERGVPVYDMRGVSAVIDPDDRLFGVLRWKLGTNGRVVENLGEWEYPVVPTLHKAFRAYMSIR
ncbi:MULTISPECIES: peptidoglycan bridge formation glycyltransferase FemA/FemB family protein [unclassified Embleya]|uniref:lipid II:glycine glycyltransferase FemX n=1 Tax=unclassified Embleya TaxID=2699296 RepID=UPI0033F22971